MAKDMVRKNRIDNSIAYPSTGHQVGSSPSEEGPLNFLVTQCLIERQYNGRHTSNMGAPKIPINSIQCMYFVKLRL